MIIGLTGGIGSGKSEVSLRFEKFDITIVDADLVARDVVELGKPALAEISTHFGADILNADGSLNRHKLRKIVFDSPPEKVWLENLLHPIIRNEIITQLSQSKSPYSILSSPLLLETSQHQLVARVLVVDSSEDLQLTRASQRDADSSDQIKKIMSAQMSRTERCSKADDIIYNHGNFNELDAQIERLHTHYLTIAQQSS
jgi:dephospho-CoA kinase